MTTNNIHILDEFEDLDLRKEKIQELAIGGHRRLASTIYKNKYIILNGLRSDLVDNPDYLDLLQEECYRLEEINSPNTPTPIKLYEDSPIGPCLAIWGVNGTLLANMLDKNLSERDKVKLATRLVEALKTLHDQDAVHGDIRVDSIVVSGIGFEPLFFNLAIEDNDTYNEFIQSRKNDIFTPPEYANGVKLTKTADVYSMGQVLKALKLGPKYAGIIRHATEKDPAKRYQSASEMLAAMRAVGKHSRNVYVALMIAVAIVIVVVAYLTLVRPMSAYNSANESNVSVEPTEQAAP